MFIPDLNQIYTPDLLVSKSNANSCGDVCLRQLLLEDGFAST